MQQLARLALLLVVLALVFGLVVPAVIRTTVEQYAEHYGAFPTIIATGGDAELLFRGDEFVDRVVPDLTLLGIVLAGRKAMATASDDGDAA